MELVYTFNITEDICEIEGLLNELNNTVETEGLEIVNSKLESDDETVEL
jgi:hypothetical protein